MRKDFSARDHHGSARSMCAGPSQWRWSPTMRCLLDRGLLGRGCRPCIGQVREYIAKQRDRPEDIIVEMHCMKSSLDQQGLSSGALYSRHGRSIADHYLVAVGSCGAQGPLREGADRRQVDLQHQLCHHDRPAQDSCDRIRPGDEAQAHAPNEINRIDDLEICARSTRCSLQPGRKELESSVLPLYT